MKINRGLLIVAIAWTGCSSEKKFNVPALSDGPILEQVQQRDLPEYAPAYGISVNNEGRLQFEVNIEAEDSPNVDVGKNATAVIFPSTSPIRCRVARILRAASSETGQAIAWLTPETPLSVPSGEFLYANITTRVKQGVLAAPETSLFFRNGRTWVIRLSASSEGKPKYDPVEVKTGIASGGIVEIQSGLSAQDQIVAQGGIGFLFADFKANQEGND